MRADHLRLTHALLRPEMALAAAEALRGARDPAAVEGLIELVCAPCTAKEATTALAVLDGCDSPIVLDALAAALDSPHATVRLAAVESLRRRAINSFTDALIRLIHRDESWPVRRAALDALAAAPDPDRWGILGAATDPHWRVRHALILALLRWGAGEANRQEIDRRLAAAGAEARACGLREYLRYRWSGAPPATLPEPDDPARRCPFWDWDPAVLARNIERLGPAGRRAALDVMPFLLGHADERVRAVAAGTLADAGGPRHLAEALALLDEPRLGVGESVTKLFGSFDLDRTEEVARFLLRMPVPTPAQLAWALDQVGPVFPAQEEQATLLLLMGNPAGQPAVVRRALARLAARWERPEAEGWLRLFLEDRDPEVRLDALRGRGARSGAPLDEGALRPLLTAASPALRAEAVRVAVRHGGSAGLGPLAADPDARVRLALAESLAARSEEQAAALLAALRADPHPHVRAAALTPAGAAELVANPARETSWHVLSRAARLAKVPLWHLAPADPWQPAPPPAAVAEPLHPIPAAPPHARRLGRDGPLVSVLGISGHYGLPVEGFVRAVEAGVNLMFWEPNYRTLTEFCDRLSPADRAALHLVAGTFEADGTRVRRDAERALRSLKTERLDLFLLFWVQSWQRVSPDVRAALERLKEEGKVAAYGLSTHSRPLAVEAMEAGWGPVMVRHSAAHRGAEERVFPRAAELGTSVITFNNTCYGRLLEPRDGQPAPAAADCYRYSLAQPAVCCCLSAPATLGQLDENLAALRDPSLPDEQRRRLEEHGASLYREETTFRRLVRAL
jgi:diketogulonate reductase-like aldo/keto reductase